MWLSTARGTMDHDPILYALRDRVSWAIGLALALASIAMSAVAQVLLKLGMTGGGVRDAIAQGSPIGTILWLAVLARAELSQAYPFVGLSFVLTAAMGYFLFADALTPMR